MESYVTEELPALLFGQFPADHSRQGITGHSMGGHGALTLHLKNPETYRSCSALAPVSSPAAVPWGRKAFAAYLGENEAAWRAHDASALVRERPSGAHLLIDTGSADPFLEEQLRPALFEAACREVGQPVTSRLREGYDHSYYFVASVIEEHVAHHASALKAS
jgi:S-formylglutathione hydrolase